MLTQGLDFDDMVDTIKGKMDLRSGASSNLNYCEAFAITAMNTVVCE
jgi:hypothetical protein